MDASSFLFIFSTAIGALCKGEGVLQCFGSALFFYADPYPDPGSKKNSDLVSRCYFCELIFLL